MAYIKTSMTAGMAVRGTIKRRLKEYCFNRGLKLDIQEDKGFLESLLLIKIEGTKDKLLKAMPELERWFREIADD